jgi:Domain of unknown function (DUF4349)/Putative zinc-finger
MNKISHPIEPEELMAYLDGELAADRAAATAVHLSECAECQRLVAELRDVSQNLNAWKIELAEAETQPAIANALAENRPISRDVLLAHRSHRRNWREVLGQRRWALAWVGGVAAVLMLVFGTLQFQERNADVSFSQVGSAVDDSGSDRDHLAVSLAPPSAPAGRPVNGREFDKRQRISANLQGADVSGSPQQPDKATGERVQVTNGPMIIRTAQLSVITKEFDKARANLEGILKRHRGYVGELKAGGSTGSGRSLTATLRVPADQLDATLTEVKTLGRVESESQSGQDVTSQYVDLQARLSNARNTEQRLTDLLRNRTGKLSDVLEVEQELDRVRGEIEQMEAERKNMSNQVSYATLNATIAEDYKAQLQVVPPSTSTRLSNAAVEGYRSMADGVVSLALFLLSTGPSLLLWGVVLFLPARLIWKKVRRSFAS